MTDWFGTAIRGSSSRSPGDRQVIDASGGEPQATVSAAVSDERALRAMANGAQSHALDFDDTHLPSVVHGSRPVAPVVLALGSGSTSPAPPCSRRSSRASRWRPGSAADRRRMTERGWHVDRDPGSLRRGAAAGKLLRLDAAQLANALGIAGTQAPDCWPRSGRWRSLPPGQGGDERPARGDARPRRLHRLDAMLDGPGSLSETYLGISDMSAAARTSASATSSSTTARSSTRRATCARQVDAARGIRARRGRRRRRHRAVHCRVHPLVMKVANQREPQTDLEAKFSIGTARRSAPARRRRRSRLRCGGDSDPASRGCWRA